jgi:DNA-binding SARP family transcriptional activator
MLEFRILGPLEVIGPDGHTLELGGGRPRSLLALLLLRANKVVTTDSLIDALWGERPPPTARAALYNAIAALRNLLGAEVIVAPKGVAGYRLVAARDSIDLNHFERLVAEARVLESEERSARLREALALWRGEPLPELRFEPWAERELLRLEELELATLEDRIAADIECGRSADVVPELQALAAREPVREHLRDLLMRALAHTGRTADVSTAFRDARAAFAEHGLDVSPELHALYVQIINNALPQPVPAQPPSDKTHFDAVADAVAAGKLVPVLGADVGALAEQLARRFEYAENGHELARVAQFVLLTKGSGPLYEELDRLLQAAATPTEVHRFFASLPPWLRERGLPHQLLVTTSYDLALEQALLDAGEEFDVVSYLASGRDRGRFCHRDPSGETRVIDLPNTYATELSLEQRTVVLKLHGGLDSESFVVTEDDYIGYLARTDVGASVPVALAAKLRRSHFLFLGYGMREWSLRLVLDRMCAGEPPAWRSWAVLAEARPLEREFWRERKIDLLEQPLDGYVRALAERLDAPAGVVT